MTTYPIQNTVYTLTILGPEWWVFHYSENNIILQSIQWIGETNDKEIDIIL